MSEIIQTQNRSDIPDNPDVEDVGENEVVIDEEFADLPEEIGATLSNPLFDVYFEELGEKHGIQPELRPTLAACTQLVMEGVLPPTDYIGTLMEELNIDRAKAALIAQDINRDIFSPVKDALKEVHKLLPSQKTETDIAPRPVALEKAPTATIPLSAAQTPPQATAPLPQSPMASTQKDSLPHVPPAKDTSTPAPKTIMYNPPVSNPETPQPEKSVLEQKLAGIFRSNTGVMMQPGVSAGPAQHERPIPPPPVFVNTSVQQAPVQSVQVAPIGVPRPPTPKPPSTSLQAIPPQNLSGQARPPAPPLKAPPLAPGADPYREPLLPQ